jgi:putative Holliday junction resolvase
MTRVLGIDYGDAYIGIAISDESGKIAFGHSVIKGAGDKKAAIKIKNIAALNGVGVIVLGDPVNMDGSRGPRCEKTDAFKEKLRRVIKNVKIVPHDERLSTAAALRVLADAPKKNKKLFEDKIAAAIILQNYLDRVNG